MNAASTAILRRAVPAAAARAFAAGQGGMTLTRDELDALKMAVTVVVTAGVEHNMEDIKRLATAKLSVRTELVRNKNDRSGGRIYAVDVSVSGGNLILDMVQCARGVLLVWPFSFERFYDLMSKSNYKLAIVINERITMGERTVLLQTAMNTITSAMCRPPRRVEIHPVDSENTVLMATVYDLADVSRLHHITSHQKMMTARSWKSFAQLVFTTLMLSAPSYAAYAHVKRMRGAPTSAQANAAYVKDIQEMTTSYMSDTGRDEFFGMRIVH